jgi:hypothetical protein
MGGVEPINTWYYENASEIVVGRPHMHCSFNLTLKLIFSARAVTLEQRKEKKYLSVVKIPTSTRTSCKT